MCLQCFRRGEFPNRGQASIALRTIKRGVISDHRVKPASPHVTVAEALGIDGERFSGGRMHHDPSTFTVSCCGDSLIIDTSVPNDGVLRGQPAEVAGLIAVQDSRLDMLDLACSR